jgi:hypothetical protein
VAVIGTLVAWWAVASAQEPSTDAASEQSKGVSVSINDDFEIRYWQLDARLPDPDDVPVLNYIEQVNRLNGNVSAGRWAFSAQIDEVSLWANRYYLDDVLYVENVLTPEDMPSVFGNTRFAETAYVNLEKVRASFEDSWGSVALGDSYVAFGRGIALNLNRNVDIDIDSSVQGVKAVLRPGAWDITVVAGQANRQQVFQDNPNVSPGQAITMFGDRRHLIGGVRAERFGLGPANLGAHGVVYDFVTEEGFAGALKEYDPFDAVVGGVTAEFLGVAGVDGYFEGDVFAYGQNQPSPLGEDVSPLGHALYGSTAFYPSPFVVLLEAKRYYQAERLNTTLSQELYEVAVAPTLEYERVITEDSSAALNSNDIVGARLQIDWTAIPQKLSPYVAMGLFRDSALDILHFNPTPETIFHPQAGVEWIDGEIGVLMNVGYRVDDRDGRFGADRHAHVDLSSNFPLPGKFLGYVAAYAESYRWGVNPLQQTDYFESETSYSLAYASDAAFTVYLDYTTNPIVKASGRQGNINEALFLAGEIQVKPAKAFTIKAFYGAQKAGIRCAGGQCRQLPGFEGARLSAVGTF